MLQYLVDLDPGEEDAPESRSAGHDEAVPVGHGVPGQVCQGAYEQSEDDGEEP
jgi:hypothetical protein